ncbi:MAG TPA: amidohydrolase [Segeticoccus sp.]|uniref:amidohydrolase n=1 Tax=Segeticoccus sp. TaxID=2706531 RepID=UPI002D7EAF1D|nr:amidohydrolase [Segeticoccus sp.]HET8599065.1 amidohydrolase [Segeticoccus sp.]
MPPAEPRGSSDVAAAPSRGSSDVADVVFTRGRVFCGDPARRFATAVAVRGDRILAVGHGEVEELIGPRTEVVDLAGRLLVPGIQDAHLHPVQGGLERLRCDLTGQETREDCLAQVKRYAGAHPGAEWILGGGWPMAAFPGGTPTAEDLDLVVPDRPAFLPNRDHHGAWVNSLALRLAGIDEGTPDPADGRIERDDRGRPTGTLHEGAMDLVGRLVPEPTPEELLAGLLEAQRYLHSLGITGWQDALLGTYANLTDASGAYLAADADGLLTAKVVGALWWRRDRGLEQVAELVERRDSLSGGRLRPTSVKIMQDGVAENHTAGMLEPYLDHHGCPGHNRGLSFVDPELLREAVPQLDAAGFQVHVHAIGDRAVREALDAIEAARDRNGPHDLRHHLAHIQVVHPDDLPRFRALGVVANMQPFWAVHEPQMDDLTIPFLGQERAGWQYPFGALLASGATLAGGSDWPVTTPDPWQGIHVAVNRTPPEDPSARPLLPRQAIDATAALTAYTAGSAYVNHADECGTIASGKAADLVLLDRDPLAGPVEELAATRVLATYVDGRLVHEAGRQ